MSHGERADSRVSPTSIIGFALVVKRIGYGAMQLTGPKVWGDYPDRAGGIALLKAVVAAGVTFIDTAANVAGVYAALRDDLFLGSRTRLTFCMPFA